MTNARNLAEVGRIEGLSLDNAIINGNFDIWQRGTSANGGGYLADRWVVTKSYEINTAMPQEWLNYRQALRDIPQQTGFPDNVVWPTAPQIG